MEQAEAIVIAVVQQSLEFAVCYLEKSEFNADDLSNQVCGSFSNLCWLILVILKLVQNILNYFLLILLCLF